jgi:hypothetical protein
MKVVRSTLEKNMPPSNTLLTWVSTARNERLRLTFSHQSPVRTKGKLEKAGSHESPEVQTSLLLAGEIVKTELDFSPTLRLSIANFLWERNRLRNSWNHGRLNKPNISMQLGVDVSTDC